MMTKARAISSTSIVQFNDEIEDRILILESSGYKIVDIKYKPHYTSKTGVGEIYNALIIAEK